MRLFCPYCEIVHYSDEFDPSTPKAPAGASSVGVVDGLSEGELSMKRFNISDRGRFTAIVDGLSRVLNSTDCQLKRRRSMTQLKIVDCKTLPGDQSFVRAID